MNPRIRILPVPSAKGLLGGRMSGKLSWEADEPQVGQWREDMERKRKYYHIVIFPENICNLTSRNKRTSVNDSNGALQQHPLPKVRTS